MQNNAYAFFGHEFNFLTPSWSLAIEEQFYFCFPLIVTWLTCRSRLLAALHHDGRRFCAFSNAVLFSAALCPADWRWAFTLCRLDAIAVGAIIALALSDAGWRKCLEQRRNWLLAAIPVLALGALAEAKWEGILGFPLHLVRASLWSRTALGRTWTSDNNGAAIKISQVLWRYSYGLYLLHIPALGLATGILWSSDADFLDVRPDSRDPCRVGSVPPPSYCVLSSV